MLKCLEELTKIFRITTHTPKIAWVGSSDPPRVFTITFVKTLSANRNSLCRKFRRGVGSFDLPPPLRTFVLAPARGSRANSCLTDRKFRPSVGSSDKCIERPVTASFGGSGIYTPSAALSFVVASPDLNTLLSLHNLSPFPPRANP